MRSLLWSLLAFPALIGATELAPWSGRDLELHPRIANMLQRYPSHTNYLLSFGIEGSYDVLQADFEVNLAKTRKHQFSLDDLRLTGRYRWMDDILGDPVSISTGITFIKATHHSLRDPNLFHHGTTEGEAHIAIGKEFQCKDKWTTRYWGVGVIGIANHGFPWVRADIHWEKNWCDQHVFGLFVDALWGLGHKRLHTDDFHGYGHVAHRSVDVGAEYKRLTVYDSVLTLGYAYRPYASNFPKHVSTYMVRWMIPFGL